MRQRLAGGSRRRESAPTGRRSGDQQGDAIAAERADPQALADFSGYGAAAERRVVSALQHLRDGKRLRIDLDDIRRALTLPRRQQRSIAGAMQIVDAEPERNLLTVDRRLSPRQPDERLAAPGGDVQRLAIVG